MSDLQGQPTKSTTALVRRLITERNAARAEIEGLRGIGDRLAADCAAWEKRVERMDAKIERLQLIEDRTREYLDVKKSWDNTLGQLVRLKAALAEKP